MAYSANKLCDTPIEMEEIKMMSSERLESAFNALQPYFIGALQSPLTRHADIPSHKFEDAFHNLKAPLETVRRNGGLINPWDITGLKRNEVRTTAALQGLWSAGFGGDTSIRFLAEYLKVAIRGVHWLDELEKGYRVEAESSPVGDASDRVDLVIETSRHLLGIEVKIDAGLGPRQLERYIEAINRRAEILKLTPHIIFLAPTKSSLSEVRSTSWRDITTAAKLVTPAKTTKRNFIEHYIATFGDYVTRF